VVDAVRSVRCSEPRKRGEWIVRARRRRQLTQPNAPKGHLSMKNLQPILFTAAVVVGTLIFIFRFAPAALRKLVTGA
jgi:hypothetical protein